MRLLDTEAVLDFPLAGARLIEASAGTGKTYTIANLYLRHVLAGREVGQVLVVTFTVAATDELRGRIRARLFQALELLERGAEADDPFLAGLLAGIRAAGEADRAARRLRLAVRAMDEAAIYTIHGFCQRALTELAFASGQQFRAEVVADDGELLRQAVQDWWRRTGYPQDAARARFLLASLGSLEDFRGALGALAGPQEKRLLPEPRPLAEVLADFDALRPELDAIAAAWRADGPRLKGILTGSKALSRAQRCPYHPDRLEGALALLDGAFDVAGALPPEDAFAVVTAASIDANRKKSAADPDLDDPFFARCDAAETRLERLRRDLRVAALADAAAYAGRRVREARRSAQRLSFDDLLTEMHGALQGPHGDDLARALRERFPVALIDEFQDTDPIQYGIFRRIYLGENDCALVLIGDPKQAIYGFRGGDIFTYMAAKADVGAEGVYTLATNWRSTPGVVDAVNAVFGRRGADAFIYGESIPFVPVEAAPRAHRHLERGGAPQAALTLWTLPAGEDRNGKPKPLSKEAAAARAHAGVADEIARLVAEGRAGRARLGDAPVAPRDIAVLVRTSREAAELRAVLAARGVNAVAVERTGVFESAEAEDLEALLRAVLEPGDRGLARRALAAGVLGLGYAEIERRVRAEDDWAAWVEALADLRDTWQRRGFMAMFQQMLRALGIARALAAEARAERRLTNLLHLGELLQQASRARPGPDALVQWLARQREEAATEETELRLESDAALVQIVTIHGSKGLQYPVVFVPYLWSCRPRVDDPLLAFHRDGEPCLDAGSDHRDAHVLLAEQERLAEDLRVAYVALTRAESALYLVWGAAGSRDGHAGQTALAWLLHPLQSRADLEAARPDAAGALVDPGPDLERLAAEAGGAVDVAPLPEPAATAAPAPPADTPLPEARSFAGRIPADWRIRSFSALTREVHSGPPPSRAGAEEDVALGFPAGSHVGSYLHALLERLDFGGDVAAQVRAGSPGAAARHGLDHARWGEAAAAILARAVQSPLDDDGLTLAGLDPARTLRELAFDFSTGPVDMPALERLLARAAGEALPPLEAEGFRGMVTGIVDLVFEHGGRWYVADYKSNFLGPRLADYRAGRLRAAVLERRYDLQYLLYTLALHRYLGRRLPGYSYAAHFGGVYYLFLRGLRPEASPAHGVYFHRPDPDMVAALDADIFGGGP